MVLVNSGSGSSSRAAEDNFNSLDQMIGKLPDVGSIMGSNLIFGVDFTESNKETGATSFRDYCLHKIGPFQNPYQQAIASSGKALSTFQADDSIPCFGFGDEKTTDRKVFSFNPNERPCRGYEEALNRYEDIAPQLQLTGPTSFAPLIETALDIVERSGRKYHILLIFTSGQVSGWMPKEPEASNLSPQERKTFDAIDRAREYPLSIIFVGVGDGPWNVKKKFSDNIPHLKENFQFVDFTEIMSKQMPLPGNAQEFALAALKELVSQHKAMSERNIIGRGCVPLPPPHGSTLSADTPSFACNAGTYNKVTRLLGEDGLEVHSLIVGIDFTKPSEWTGKISFGGQSLHHNAPVLNPYEQVVSIIGSTLSTLQEDNSIPCFGFGDEQTTDQKVFSFNLGERPCKGYEEALKRYKEIVPYVQLAGPRSLSPIIDMAIDIVERSGRKYHVLLITACGQVSGGMLLEPESGHLSPQEQKTFAAIVRARQYPLSIIFVGVGDGPWKFMKKKFSDNIPDLEENFQFVDFTEIMSKHLRGNDQEFALAALRELRSQHTEMWRRRITGCRRVPLPPPPSSCVVDPPSAFDNQVCGICSDNPKDMVFGCGHVTCSGCGQRVAKCPYCQEEITFRLPLYY